MTETRSSALPASSEAVTSRASGEEPPLTEAAVRRLIRTELRLLSPTRRADQVSYLRRCEGVTLGPGGAPVVPPENEGGLGSRELPGAYTRAWGAYRCSGIDDIVTGSSVLCPRLACC